MFIIMIKYVHVNIIIDYWNFISREIDMRKQSEIATTDVFV